MKLLVITMGILMVTLGSACTKTSGPWLQPPSPLPPANAMVESYKALYGTIKADATADVILTTRCVSSEKFAEQRHGQWNQFWYVVTFEVLTVEKGKWDHPKVSFICMDSAPTPESGIMLDKAAWPYRLGTPMRLWLDDTKTPPQVLGQEVLSSVAATRPSPSHP